MQSVLMYGYIVALCALVLCQRERGPMRRTIWTLFAVMIAGYGYHYLIGDGWDYSAFMIAVNALACTVITRDPAGQWQGLVGWSFVVQIGADTGRVVREINGGATDMTFLYYVTTGLAFAQLLLVIGWGVHDRLSGRSGKRHPDLLPHQTLHAGAP